MKITFLGTSDGLPRPGHFRASTMIEVADRLYLIDGGAPIADLILVNGDHAFDFSANAAITASVTDLYPIWKEWPLYNYKVMNSSLKTTKRGAELINPLFDAFLKETAADLGPCTGELSKIF